ncbi:MAG: glutaredoxin 2 [Lentilactobacillus hilgardii]|uniref:glutaredoxin 2 n=1 Tax=Lentilactobacillus hilgardii TaxID=1588 RepID=UPI0039EB0467
MDTLYVYEHCPFCIKARMIFGLKAIPFQLVVLMNDDEQTPIGMVGRKVVPILQTAGRFMPESLDIIALIDSRDPPVLTGARNPAVAEWINRGRSLLYREFLPRAAMAPFPEFATTSARAYFLQHKENASTPFVTVLENAAAAVEAVNAWVQELAPLVQKPDAVNGTLSYDDIDLFALLHSLSLIKGVQYPASVQTYRQTLSKLCGIPLLDPVAI